MKFLNLVLVAALAIVTTDALAGGGTTYSGFSATDANTIGADATADSVEAMIKARNELAQKQYEERVEGGLLAAKQRRDEVRAGIESGEIEASSGNLRIAQTTDEEIEDSYRSKGQWSIYRPSTPPNVITPKIETTADGRKKIVLTGSSYQDASYGDDTSTSTTTSLYFSADGNILAKEVVTNTTQGSISSSSGTVDFFGKEEEFKKEFPELNVNSSKSRSTADGSTANIITGKLKDNSGGTTTDIQNPEGQDKICEEVLSDAGIDCPS